MKLSFKKHGIIIIQVIAILIIVAAYIVNGAEKEDAWLYIFSIALVLIPALDTYSKKKKRVVFNKPAIIRFMRTKQFLRRLFIYIFIFALAFSLSASSVLAATSREAKSKTKVEARSPLEEATVNLYCRLRAGKVTYSPSGSGVFISDKGVILTGAHVAQYFLLAKEKGRVNGWCSVRTGSPANETYTAEILYLPPVWLNDNITSISKSKPKSNGENDFALLYVTGVDKKNKKAKLPLTFPAVPLDLLSNIPKEEKVTILGYPTSKLNFKGVRQDLNSVTASSSVSDVRGFSSGLTDLLTLAPSAAASYGVSGGPVVNSAGKLAGIVVSKGVGENDLTLRALTTPYIERSLLAQTGLNFATLTSNDLALTAQKLRGFITEEMVNELVKGLWQKN